MLRVGGELLDPLAQHVLVHVQIARRLRRRDTALTHQPHCLELGARMISNQVKRLTADAVDQLPLPAEVALAIKSNVAVIATLNAQIEVLAKRLQETVGSRPQYGWLTSAPGIGQTLATVILLESGPIDRFASVGLDVHPMF